MGLMPHSVRISDDLYELVQNASLALDRPLTQQIEYWARLGAALDAAGISSSTAMRLLESGASADEVVESALADVAPDGELLMLKERHRKYEEDVAAGRRSARSLLMFQKEDLKGMTFTANPNSEFAREGGEW